MLTDLMSVAGFRTIFHDTKNKVPFTPSTATSDPPASAHYMAPESDEYEAGLTVIGEFDTVESFCRYFNWLKPPSKLERNSNYHLFKKGIKPMWEDPANANVRPLFRTLREANCRAKGGRWVLTMRNNPQLLDRCWNWLVFGLVGEDLEDGDALGDGVRTIYSREMARIRREAKAKDTLDALQGVDILEDAIVCRTNRDDIDDR